MLYCFAILLSYIPHTTPENFKARATDFEAVVAMVNKGELKQDENGQINVPCRYKYLFRSINIKLEKNTTIINFLQIISNPVASIQFTPCRGLVTKPLQTLSFDHD